MAHPITDVIYVVLVQHDVLKLQVLFPLEMHFLKQRITFLKISPFYYKRKPSGEKLFN